MHFRHQGPLELRSLAAYVQRRRRLYGEAALLLLATRRLGFVSELKHWKTVEEYERARKHVNEDRHFGFSANLWWSIFPGEEDIMYAAHLASKNVVRFNVDTEQMTDVGSDDHVAFGSAPWGYCGLFLADLVPAVGNNDRVPPSMPAMLNGVFDPPSRSIRLTWARCTDNVGVDAYNVYRDGQKITTTGFIDYTNTIKGPVSASYRYSIGAVDVAGNEAKSSEITVPAAR